jgi:aryl-phospho-beta-D-glucosidase BglC (GH1 family)
VANKKRLLRLTAAYLGGAAASIPRNARFGVNLSGAEFSPWNGQTWPSASDATYLAGLGVGFVRLPIAWESIQPTLGSALDATYLAALKSTISALKAKGISTTVGLHNFGHYITQSKWTASDGVVSGYAGNDGANATGVNVLGDGTLTAAALADVWTKLSTALVGTAGLIGYGLMNEPVNIIGTNLLTAPNYIGVNSLTPWFSSGGGSATILAAGTNPLGAGFGPAWNLTASGAFSGMVQNPTLANVAHTVSCYAKCASGTQAFQLYLGSGSTKTATTTWQRFTFTATPAAGPVTVGAIVNTAASTIQVANFQLELGSSATAYEPNPFMSFAQAAINAIRAVDAVTSIYVGGASRFSPYAWPIYNYELATLTGSGLIFDAHAYFDGAQGVGGGGGYLNTFTGYGVDTQTGVQQLTPFTDWLTATGKTGFLGEFGVPNNTTDNNPQWLPTQVNFLNALKTAGVKGTQWFYGNNGIQSSNILNIAATANDARLTQMLAVT